MMLPSKLVGQINMRIASIALAIILILIPSLPALAQESDSETITITMTTKTVIEIELNPTTWDIGTIRPEEIHESATFTMTNKGNCDLHAFIRGEEAVCVDNPDYKWELSSDGYNGNQIYVLWYKTSDCAPGGEGLITTEEGDFCSNFGIDGYNPKHFGLKLEAPWADYTKDGVEYFYGGGNMGTTITISGVIA